MPSRPPPPPPGHKYQAAEFSEGVGAKTLLEQAGRLIKLAKGRLSTSAPRRKKK